MSSICCFVSAAAEFLSRLRKRIIVRFCSVALPAVSPRLRVFQIDNLRLQTIFTTLRIHAGFVAVQTISAVRPSSVATRFAFSTARACYQDPVSIRWASFAWWLMMSLFLDPWDGHLGRPCWLQCLWYRNRHAVSADTVWLVTDAMLMSRMWTRGMRVVASTTTKKTKTIHIARSTVIARNYVTQSSSSITWWVMGTQTCESVFVVGEVLRRYLLS